MPRDYSKNSPKQQKIVCSNCQFKTQHSHTFEQVMAGDVSFDHTGNYSAIRKTPVRSAQFEADFLVPACQSLFGAVVAALPIAVMSVWLRWSWYAPLAVSSVTILVSWFRSLDQHRDALVKLEEITFYSQDDRSHLEADRPAGEPIRMEIVERNAETQMRIQFPDLPINLSVDDYIEVCRQVLQGRALTRKNFVDNGGLLTRTSFDEITEIFLQNDIMIKLGNNQKRLTERGRLTISAYLEGVGIVI